MKFSRRGLVHAGCTIAAVSLAPHFLDRAQAGLGLHGSGGFNRILFILYGQSNMEAFTSTFSGSPPAAIAGTSYYDGSSVVAVPNADGIRFLLNSVKTVTGIDCIALNGAVGGSGLAGLSKPGAAYTALLAQINAVLLPTDRTMILWDQGEGDATGNPPSPENTYKAGINQLHTDIVTDIGRTKATCPFVMASLGTSTVADATISGGTTDASWQAIKNAIYNCSIEQPFNHFSHSNMDAVRNDQYHYNAASYGRMGQRLAQTANTILGSASGEAHWQISSGAVVDATHTNINVVHNLGTDFTPTSGGNGWEVTGNNGVTWIVATASRNSATQISLTHASISTTSARKVRYQYGLLPPDAAGLNPTTAPILDNSALQIPLNFTTWEIMPTPLTVIPIPTYRYGNFLSGSGQVQTYAAVPLGPSIGAQKFVILALAGSTLAGTVTLTPRDKFGAAAGTPAVMTLVKQQTSVQILQATLGSDANAAYSVDISADFGGNPFGGYSFDLWTVPLADLSSTTATTGGASATSTAATATVNVSAAGFIIQIGHTSSSYTVAVSLSGTETFAKRKEPASGIFYYSADASNCAANAASSATPTFQNSGNIDLALAAWR